MSQPFDPYEKWFDVPPEPQPLNHYQLLGVKLYESNLKVIRSAGDKRVEFLQDVSAGQYLEQAQKCLNEVAKAVVCLTNPRKKLAYDHELKTASAAIAAPPLLAPPVVGDSGSTANPSSQADSQFSFVPSQPAPVATESNNGRAPAKPRPSKAKPKSQTKELEPQGSFWKENGKLIRSVLTICSLVTIGILIVILWSRRGGDSGSKKGVAKQNKNSSDSSSDSDNGDWRKFDSQPTQFNDTPNTSGPPVKLAVKDHSRLEKLNGQQVILQGVVFRVRQSPQKKTFYLDFDKNWKETVTVFMPLNAIGGSWNRDKLAKKYSRKRLRITAPVKRLGGKYIGVKVTDLNQIEILN